MSRKIENIWDISSSPPEEIYGTSNVYEIATISGADGELVGTIAVRKAEFEFWTGPYGDSDAQPDYITNADRIHIQEMATEYYTGVLVSGSETIVDNNITYRIVED